MIKTPLAGGASTTLWAGDSPPQQSPGPEGIAIDDGSVYWTVQTVQNGPAGQTDYAGDVLRMSKGGGAVTTLASGLNLVSGIAVDRTNVYAIDDRTLIQVPRGGGTVTTLARTPESNFDQFGVAVNSTSVFWMGLVNYVGYVVLKVPIGGGGVTTLVSTHDEMEFVNLAATETNLYWPHGGGISSVPTAGGLVTTLAAGHVRTSGLAIDDSAVYWSNSGSLDRPEINRISFEGGAITMLAPVVRSDFVGVGWFGLTVTETGVFFATVLNGFPDSTAALLGVTK